MSGSTRLMGPIIRDESHKSSCRKLARYRRSIGILNSSKLEWKFHNSCLTKWRVVYVNALSPGPPGRRCSMTSPRRDLFKQLFAMGALPGTHCFARRCGSVWLAFDPQAASEINPEIDPKAYDFWSGFLTASARPSMTGRKTRAAARPPRPARMMCNLCFCIMERKDSRMPSNSIPTTWWTVAMSW